MKNTFFYIIFSPATILLFLMLLFICGCTYNISMVHTEGTASQIADDPTSISPNISPTITAIPSIPGIK